MAKFIEVTNEDGSKDYLPGDPDAMMELYGTDTFFPPKKEIGKVKDRTLQQVPDRYPPKNGKKNRTPEE